MPPESPKPAPPGDPFAPIEESLTTADGVLLKGRFHRSPNGWKQQAVVVLMYQPGPGQSLQNMTHWDGAIRELNRAGFHVFCFDWRGHGKSTAIVDAELFWSNPITGPWNRKHVRGANQQPAKTTLSVGDILPRYFPAYVQDLAAVRFHLDGKNDTADINTSSIYLIGEGDTAALGFLWLTAEWVRPSQLRALGTGPRYKVVPMVPNAVVGRPAGQDVAGSIWLNASRPPAIQDSLLRGWSNHALSLRTENPMMFMFDEQDAQAKSESRMYYDRVLAAKGNKQLGIPPLEQTFLIEVKGMKPRASLLGQDLETEGTILKYLTARQGSRGYLPRFERRYAEPYLINLSHFGLNP